MTRCQQAAAFRMVRNRLYFLRIHHITEALMRERSGCSSERSAPYGDRLMATTTGWVIGPPNRIRFRIKSVR